MSAKARRISLRVDVTDSVIVLVAHGNIIRSLVARALVPLRQFLETVGALRKEALAREPSPEGARGLGLRRLFERVLELSGYGAALAREDRRFNSAYLKKEFGSTFIVDFREEWKDKDIKRAVERLEMLRVIRES